MTKKPFGFEYFNIMENPLRYIVFCIVAPYCYAKYIKHTLYVAWLAFRNEIKNFWEFSHTEASDTSNYVVEWGLPKALNRESKYSGITYVPYKALLAMGSGGRDTDKIVEQAFQHVQEKNVMKREAFAKSRFEFYGKMCHDHHIKAADLNI